MIYFAIFTDLLITIILIFNVYRINKDKKQIRDYKFQIYSRYMILIAIAIVLVLVSIYEFIFSYLKTSSVIPLLNAYVYFVILILICIYLSNKNYLCDSGVWFLGRLYKWSQITTYLWIKDSRYILFVINDNSIMSEYKLRFRIEKEQKEEIEAFLSKTIRNI
ncbi:MAG: hypothetical protein K0S61_4546 [Anaerocolumna sp.]|jgi:FlaA1/EpsC-like NDP-sugar epimerase|nr:hypothetical protein [Anaerocolumna sp.]